jgi:hypothetical protein
MKPTKFASGKTTGLLAAEGTRLASNASPPASLRPSAATSRHSETRRWRQSALLTLSAIALFISIRLLPTGTNLSHMDFRAQGKNVIEFCDPLNPQFLPVVAVRSPVTMTVLTEAQPVAHQTVEATLTLVTSTGKPIGPADLLVAHMQKMHLLIVDPTLADYQHVHPMPGRRPGEWTFQFTPRWGGLYRLFADFTPAATGRGLYASTDLPVAGIVGPVDDRAARPRVGPTTEVGATKTFAPMTVAVDGYSFILTSAAPLQANRPADLALSVRRPDGGRVPLEPIMGAFAHLVAFDEARSGFAHLHPNETDLTRPPDTVTPRLTFKVTIPRAGRYAVWAQVKLGGREVFAPFGVEVKD